MNRIADHFQNPNPGRAEVQELRQRLAELEVRQVVVESEVTKALQTISARLTAVEAMLLALRPLVIGNCTDIACLKHPVPEEGA